MDIERTESWVVCLSVWEGLLGGELVLQTDNLVMRSFAMLLGAASVSSYMLSTPAGGVQQRHAEPAMAVTKVSRRKAALDTEVDREKLYAPVEALSIVKKTSTAKFIETIELHANLNLDPKYNDQQIRTTVSLPAGTGKTVRVAVLAEGPAADAATAAGADIVGMTELIETISAGQIDFDVLLATPPAMPKLAKLGKVLGPKVRQTTPCHTLRTVSHRTTTPHTISQPPSATDTGEPPSLPALAGGSRPPLPHCHHSR